MVMLNNRAIGHPATEGTSRHSLTQPQVSHTVNAGSGIWVLRKRVPLEPAAKDGQFMAH
jgi:hypothetical protein